MRSTLRTVFARAEIMFVLLAGAVFVCWQQERAERQERALLRAAVEAERKREIAAQEEEDRWEAENEAKADEARRNRTAPPPREVKQPQ